MAITNNLELVLVETAQSQKEVTVNEALVRLDALMNVAVIDADLAAPPGSPAAGDLYVVAASATGDWAGKDGQIAYYDGVWRFVMPKQGMRLFVADEKREILYHGAGWRDAGAYDRNVLTVATSGSAVTCDLSKGLCYHVTLTEASVTLSITNTPSGDNEILLRLWVRQDATGGRSISWPGSVVWDGGSAPALTSSANALDIIDLVCIDGGVTWVGKVYGLDFS